MKILFLAYVLGIVANGELLTLPVVGSKYKTSSTGDGLDAQNPNVGLTTPSGIKFNIFGELFIADKFYLRKVGTDNIISRVAGTGSNSPSSVAQTFSGPATSATVFPTGLCASSSGSIYIAETNFNVIRKWDLDGTISMFVGTGFAPSSQPSEDDPATSINISAQYCAVDSVGNIYFSSFQYSVSKVSASTQKFSTVAGIGVSSTNYIVSGAATSFPITNPTVSFTDSASQIYFAEYLGYRVLKLDTTSNQINTITGTYGSNSNQGDGGDASSARLNGLKPFVAKDPATGDLFISLGMYVRKIDGATNIIDTVAGTDGETGFGGNSGPAIAAQFDNIQQMDAQNNGIYLTDMNNQMIRALAQSTTTPTIVPSVSPTAAPTAEPSQKPSQLPSTEPSTCPSAAPSESPTPVPTTSPSLKPTEAPSMVPSQLPSTEPTNKPSISPSIEPTIIPSKEPTLSPTELPSLTPTSSPTTEPSREPTSLPTFEPSATPSSEPTTPPTSMSSSTLPTTEPTLNPTPKPTLESTREPTNLPTYGPTNCPSADPTVEPTSLPISEPTSLPTSEPTSLPTSEPTSLPTSELSVPTSEPTSLPTSEFSSAPTSEPTRLPTSELSSVPTSEPTRLPTSEPTRLPTSELSSVPTSEPTRLPTSELSSLPTSEPTRLPTSELSSLPTSEPTRPPTSELSSVPTSELTSVPTSELSSVPTSETTSLLTYVPSAIPSTMPSTDDSTTEPTTQPGLPTTSPSILYSIEPSTCSSISPTHVPSTSTVASSPPTTEPSMEQTTTDSAIPSEPPSATPSSQVLSSEAPSTTPTSTHCPSASPTHSFRPSEIPTAKPSLKPYVHIYFDSTLTVSNVATPVLSDATAQDTVCRAVTVTTGIAQDKCKYMQRNSMRSTSSASARILDSVSSYTVNATVRIFASTGDFSDTEDDTDGDDLYLKLRGLLDTAVHTKAFSLTLRDMALTMNATVLMNVTDVGLTMTSYSIVFNPAAPEKSGRTVNTLSVTIIATIIALLITFCVAARISGWGSNILANGMNNNFDMGRVHTQAEVDAFQRAHAGGMRLARNNDPVRRAKKEMERALQLRRSVYKRQVAERESALAVALARQNAQRHVQLNRVRQVKVHSRAGHYTDRPEGVVVVERQRYATDAEAAAAMARMEQGTLYDGEVDLERFTWGDAKSELTNEEDKD